MEGNSSQSGEDYLQFSDDAIVANARAQFSDSTLVGIALKQAFYENLLRVKKHVSFRHRENSAATQAYCAMSREEFNGINARQNWSNWRTVPRNLSGRLPKRPIKIIDLCSGMGHSSDVLAFYAPEGSEILGLEYNPQFVEVARARTYQTRSGKKLHAQFNAQSVLDPFRYPDGKLVADGSADLINCCGAVGHHFDPSTTAKLALQIRRVTHPDSLVLLDSGKDGTNKEQLLSIMGDQGFRQLHSAKSSILDRYVQVCFVRE